MSNLSVLCPINKLGYGRVGLNIVNELMNMDVNISLFPLGQIDCESRYIENIKKSIENAKYFDHLSPSLKIWHPWDLAQNVSTTNRINFPIFESDRFSSVEEHHLSSSDNIFVASKWAKNIIKNSKIKVPTYVIPLGVRNDIFKPAKSTRKDTIFICIGKNEVRKGHDFVVENFNKCFNINEKVCLFMMTYNPFYSDEQNKEIMQSYKNTKMGEKIFFVPRQNNEDDVVRIMQMSDCGLFMSRSEGWNLELLEILSCGKFVVATHCSGHTEFCTPEAVKLIETTKKEKSYGRPGLDDRWFKGDFNWSSLEGTEDEFISHMRQIHEKKQFGNLDINHAGIETARQFSWTNTAQKIMDSL